MSRASPLRDSTACALALVVLSCPVAVCVHVHERRKFVDLDRSLCARNTFTFTSSLSVGHVIILAVSLTLYMMSARSWHMCSSFPRLASRSPARPVTLSLVSSPHLESTLVSSLLRIRLNRVSTSRSLNTLPRKKIWSPSFSIRPTIRIKT